MIEREICEVWEEVEAQFGKPPTDHDAWPHFVHHMRGKQYGWDALLQAWGFFKLGWESK